MTSAPKPPIKRRRTTTRPQKLCEVHITIVRTPSRHSDSALYVIKRTDKHISHSHDLAMSDHFKVNSFILKTAQYFGSMLFQPHHIFDTMSGTTSATGSSILKEAGGEFFNRQHIVNAQNHARQLNPDARIFSTTLTSDLTAAIDFLNGKNYLTFQFEIRESHAMVFANDERLKTLMRRGYLTLFDSTHNTNVHGHRLFTFMVRNEYGIWIPCAHALVENERADILTECMRTIKLWCRGNWPLRYALTDDSATERLAVRQAFPGVDGGETNVTHLLCTVHSSRTLMRRLSHAPESRKHLNSAMFNRKTEGGCLEDINLAINSAPNDETRQYIINEWLNDRYAWAMFARQHSALLLQVSTTNPVEAWHKQIKQHCQKKRLI
jgi:MULE transposase domain